MTSHATFARRFVERHRAELVAFRRHLHAYPEPSYEERETTDLVAQRLSAAGLKPKVLDDGCGLICDIGGHDTSRPNGGDRDPDGPIVALRADLDALLMDDEKDVAYRSKRPGVAHACGHDVHTTIVLGAGLALAELFARDAVPGRVRLIFEPGEEALPSGALRMIEAGALDDVDAIFGVHCDPKLDVGRVALRTGPLTSATDLVDVQLRGPGGHTARPHVTVDLVRVAGSLAAELPDRVRAKAAPLGEVLLVFGMIAAGHAPNVIPAHAHLRGSVRTPERSAWAAAERIVEESLAELLGPTGASWALEYQRGIPPTVNDPVETDRLRAIAHRLVAETDVVEAPQSLGGDSFAWYLEQVPGSYARLGVHDPAAGTDRLDLHSSVFDVDERAIDLGVQLLMLAALDALAQPAGTD
jgi:amidohydrolase